MRHTRVFGILLLLALGAWACGNPSSDPSSTPDTPDLKAEGSTEGEEPPALNDPLAEEPSGEEPPTSDDPLAEVPSVEEAPSSSGGIPVRDPLPGNPLPPDNPLLPDNPLPAQTAAWQLTLKVSVPDSTADTGMAYNRLVAGSETMATDWFDNAWDIRALLAGPIQAYFDHSGEAGYDMTTEELWQDIRQAELPGQWVIEVFTGSGRVVTVEWALPEGEVSCAAYQFILQDSDGQLADTDMCVTPSLTYDGNGQMRHFVLRIS